MGVRARSSSSMRTTGKLLLVVVLMALAVTAAHAARTGLRPGPSGNGRGAGTTRTRRSVLDAAATQRRSSCCTHDRNRNTGGSSCWRAAYS
ncbi:hypothetical protein BS78_01G104200 [Paspalum vaginatum]|nr:hypothetical protein BS78_01G104200 [Paspalum vaginatum]